MVRNYYPMDKDYSAFLDECSNFYENLNAISPLVESESTE